MQRQRIEPWLKLCCLTKILCALISTEEIFRLCCVSPQSVISTVISTVQIHEIHQRYSAGDGRDDDENRRPHQANNPWRHCRNSLEWNGIKSEATSPSCLLKSFLIVTVWNKYPRTNSTAWALDEDESCPKSLLIIAVHCPERPDESDESTNLLFGSPNLLLEMSRNGLINRIFDLFYITMFMSSKSAVLHSSTTQIQ